MLILPRTTLKSEKYEGTFTSTLLTLIPKSLSSSLITFVIDAKAKSKSTITPFLMPVDLIVEDESKFNLPLYNSHVTAFIVSLPRSMLV